MTSTPDPASADWAAQAQFADAPTARRSALVFIVLGAIAVVCLIANVVGGMNFPYNAPVEQITCFGIVVDMVAVIILSIIGVIVARQPIAVRPSSALSFVGMLLTGLALAAVVLLAIIPSILDLAGGVRLHYSTETTATFVLAPVWITGLAFSGFSFRIGGDRRNTLFSLLGLGFGVLVLVLAAAAAVLYGLGLST
jgi:hypothetical protein